MVDNGGGGSLDGWIPMSGGDSDVDDGWIPTTDLGRQVKAGEIRSLEEIHTRSLPVEEHQIMDKLFGSSLEKLAMVQEYQTKGGETRVKAFVLVGDRKGHVGLGVYCGKEKSTAVDRALIRAKLGMIPVRMGYWQKETAGKPYTLPRKIIGECKSVTVMMDPAPRGFGILAEVPMKKVHLEVSMNKVLELAGVADVITSCWGSPRTLENLVTATYECLKVSDDEAVAETAAPHHQLIISGD